MKKILVAILAVTFIFGFSATAKAVTVTVNATGDNILWYWSNPLWTGGTGTWAQWQNMNSFSLPGNMGDAIDLYFAVKNELAPGIPLRDNPAGFLAQITTSAGFFQENGSSMLLSNTTDWEILDVTSPATFPTGNPSLLSGYYSPDWYAYNSGAINSIYAGGPGVGEGIDYNGNGKSRWYDGYNTTVSGINNGAQWIWTPDFYNDRKDYAILRTTVTPVPEPATMILLGLGAAGLAALRRKRAA